MNGLPVIRYSYYAQRTRGSSGGGGGGTLEVARRKCIAKSCFNFQKNDLGEKSTLFRRRFMANGFEKC